MTWPDAYGSAALAEPDIQLIEGVEEAVLTIQPYPHPAVLGVLSIHTM